MVVEARDSLALGEGFDGDASPDMPLDDATMPDGTDAFAESEPEFDPSAATDGEDGLVSDDPRLAELQSQLDDLASQRELWNKARSSLEAKVNSFHQSAQRASLREQAMSHWLNSYFDENGLDKRDLAVMENNLNKVERQQQQQSQQIAAGFTESLQTLFSNHQARLAQMAFQGEQQVFDPKDPEIEQAFLSAAALVKRHHDEEGARPGTALQAQATQSFERLKDLMRVKREQGLLAQANQGRQANAQRQQANRAKQDDRGRQLRTKGGQAPPSSFNDYMAQAKTALPNATYKEQWEWAVRTSGANQQPAR